LELSEQDFAGKILALYCGTISCNITAKKDIELDSSFLCEILQGKISLSTATS
jgi:hypothetical protein